MTKRLQQYYNYNHLADPRTNMLIHKALLKYGYSEFRFDILEYCNKEEVKAREQHYLELLKPKYNILKIAGSSLGYKHTPASLKKMSEAKSNLKGKLNPMFGKTHTADTREKISTKMNKPVTFYNSNNQYILTFKNSVQLAEFLGCHKITVSRYVKSGKCYKELYYFLPDGRIIS